ncbi:hypothetical protein [Lysobacter sp. ESA13C]|uniref:hypothetical protein n=1 Tax=Lysobacter sp. ESA13C TaxID=2862676 RepID=UPI001CBBC729|nr:hypothetical protein [Lysobacter sp. ESA13C]
MNYAGLDREMAVGDIVLVEGAAQGLVICDFERWLCLDGYEDWLTKKEMVGGGYLSSGVLVKTAEMGMVHYAVPDATIVFVESSNG